MPEKLVMVWIATGVLAVFGGVIVTGQLDDFIPAPPNAVIDEPLPRSQIITMHVPPHRVAVDLEIVGSKFYVLWNNGTVTAETPLLGDLIDRGDCPEDINGDGVVGQPDLLKLLAAMGKKCP